jgi:hypothetical protein
MVLKHGLYNSILGLQDTDPLDPGWLPFGYYSRRQKVEFQDSGLYIINFSERIQKQRNLLSGATNYISPDPYDIRQCSDLNEAQPVLQI